MKISNNNFKQFLVEQHEIGWTLRKWARYHLPTLSFPILAKVTRKKDIKLNDAKTNLNNILKAEDIIAVHHSLISPITERKVDLNPIKEMICFENDDYAVIEKPIGITAQGEENSIAQLTNCYIVHKIDKTTSGLMVIAKHKLAADHLSEQIRNKQIKKEYEAVLALEPESNLSQEGTWNFLIDEKEAITEYNIIKQLPNLALAKIQLITGYKHQIRIHASKANCPILGDTQYGGPDANRIYLHSMYLQFKNLKNELVTYISKNGLTMPL